MQDRVPVNPGRVLITPENGGAAYYATMTRADNPTQEGTPLNKNTLLKDATAALFGLGSGAVPDDVLNQLGGLANYYIWRKSTLSEPSSYTLGPEHELTMFDNRNLTSGDTKSFHYSSNVSVSSDGFTISLNSPSSVQIKQNYGGTISAASVLYGKFVSVNNSIYFYPADCVVTGNYVSSSSTPVIASKAQLVSGVAAQYETSYVFSPERNKYPDDGESVGSTYEYMGQLGDKARIATGSYVGTGQYGSSNPNSLTFDFEPRFVIISNPYNQNVSADSDVAILHNFEPVPNNATTYAGFSRTGSSATLNLLNRRGVETITASNVAKWYSTSADRQLNRSGWVYRYMAIG